MSTEEGIRQLQRTFGNQLDRDVLESVLELHAGDVKAATAFLQATGTNDFVETAAPAGSGTLSSLPKDYLKKPVGYDSSLIEKLSQRHTRETDGNPSSVSVKALEAAGSIRDFLLKENTSFHEHQELLKKYGANFYAAVLLLMIHQSVEISAATKGRVLAILWAHRNGESDTTESTSSKVSKSKLNLGNVVDYLLKKHRIEFSLPEVLRALKCLDGPRKVRALEKKLSRLQAQGTAKPRTLGQVRAKINDVKKDTPEGQVTSVTGALAKKIRHWATTIPSNDLEFYALQMPKEPWQEVADLVHFKPTDFAVNWYLQFIFGGDAPEDSMVRFCATHPLNGLSEKQLEEGCSKFKIPYSYLRKQVPELPPTVKAAVARYEKLDTVIWYYEELNCPEVDIIIFERLKNGEEPSFSYGKLMERLLYFKQQKAPFYHSLIPIAEKRMRAYTLPLDPPVVVLGDASYSMDVAIRTATVIGSLLTALTSADLKFFNVRLLDPHIVPRTIPQVLDVATETKADGLTAPACAVWDYLKKKQVVRYFIVVTDEIENIESEGMFFAQAFYRYYTEIFPAKIVFVSFLEDPKVKGRMVNALESLGLVPLQFRLDARRPDLTKVDSLLGLLASEHSLFAKQSEKMASFLEGGLDIDSAFDALIPATTSTSSSIPQAHLFPEKEKIEENKGKDKEEVSVENSNEDDDGLCIICLNEKADMVVLECGHLKYCSKCVADLKTCSFCRQPIVRTLKVFR